MRLLLFTGTGGAGTTTVAAATAVRAARRGVKTLLLTPEPSTPPPLGSSEGEVEPGLVLRTVDAAARTERAWALCGGPAALLLAALGADPLEAGELTGLPGLDDLLTLLELRDAAAGGWDLVVVDAPPLARVVRLLSLPEAVARGVDRGMPLERRMLWAMGHGASSTSGAGPSRAAVEAAEHVQAEARAVRSVLDDPGTAVRLVVPPQRAAVEAATTARTSLALHGLAVDAVVLNRLVPGGDHPWLRERVRAEAAVAAAAEVAFAPLPVVRVGELALPPAGADDLAALDLDAADDAGPLEAPGIRVERDGDGFALVLPLPRARRAGLGLARRGDELVVDLAGDRRVFPLPSVLRRCEVTTARLRDGALRVAFRPDPDLWRSW
jgi:arsenite/tail-anchored protein-transporting ATPase